MKQDVWRTDWHLVTNAEAHQVTGSTATPDGVYPYDIQKLPSQLQKLPGLYAAYISGYSTASNSPENVSVLGEVAAVRADEGVGKGYVWAFGVSGSGVYINGPYKFFDGHHFQDTGSVPVEKLFGNVPPYPSRDTVATETQAVTPPDKPTPAQEPPHLLTPLAALWPTDTLREPPKTPKAAVKPTAPQTVKMTFVLLEPGAKQVFLCGEFNGWASDATPMKRDDAGHWETTLALAPGRYEYKFIVDGNWKHDPLARVKVWNQNGTLNSVAQVWA